MRKVSFLMLLMALTLLTFNAKATIVEVDVKGEINQGTVELVKEGFDLAKEEKAKAVLIVLDTPGGLLYSTKEIVSMILNSDIPVITYVPKGGFSASAGTIILLSGHLSAMANGTSIGSATPVGVSGEERNKTVNYVASYLESIAEMKGKPKDVVRRFVTEGISLTAREAYELGVVDILADSKEELLEKVDGRKVDLDGKVVVLHTKGERLIVVERTLRSEIAGLLSDPIVILLLLLIGIYALIIGFSTPGIGLELVGVVCLLLALFGLQVISFDYLALLLIILGAILIVFELLIPTHGILAILSVILIVFGSSILLKEPFIPDKNVVYFMTGVGLGIASFMSFAVIKVFQTRRMRAKVGEIVGEVGEVVEFSNGRGFVKVRGEIWMCRSEEDLKKGEEVVVVGREGLTLWVKRKS